MTDNNEKRQELRLNSQETIFIEVDTGVDNEPPQIVISNSVDISANGVHLEIDRPLVVGSIHRLCLQLVNPEQRLYVSAKVAWSRRLMVDEGFAIGLNVLESEGTDIQHWKTLIARRCRE